MPKEHADSWWHDVAENQPSRPSPSQVIADVTLGASLVFLAAVLEVIYRVFR